MIAAPQAIANPVSTATLRQNAQQAYQSGRLREALQFYQQALRLEPRNAELLCDLGNLHQDLDDRNAAFDCYRQSVELEPRQTLTQRNLGVLYLHRNQPQQALRHFELAQQAEPHPMNLMLAAKVLPVIYESTEQVASWRDRLTKCLANLVSTGVTIDASSSFIQTTFYFAYQGENDRPLMEHVGKIYRGVETCPPASAGGWKPRGKRLRVGFASAYFCQHTIGLLNLGLIQRLPRDRFEVTVIALRKQADVWSESFRKGADHYVEVPRQPARARQAIADLNLDILIFADVGMDALAQTLCYSRMAPLQALTWGHPDTTGSPTMDRFISSDLAEAADAQDHYTERLVRLPNMGVCYERPVLDGPRRTRAQFGLDPNRRVYLCPQTLFKFHPEFDEPLQRILQADPGGDLVLLSGSNPEWVEALRHRWRNVLPDVDRRVKFLPGLPRADFLHLLAMADVMLDPFPFCGGNTSLEGFAMGTPIVTLPGKYLRGRLTYGMYRRMGLEELVPKTVAGYAEQAVRLATDPTTRRQHSEAILQACPRLYDSQEDVLAWADALEAMAAEYR
jgi:predicted O-linked N-acetylglucosamine transferase (SPINDLY family)